MRLSLPMFLESRMPASCHAAIIVSLMINAGNAQRPEKIALAAFVHADARREQFRIQNGFVAQFGLLQDFRLQHEFNKILRALALHHQLAALVKNDVCLLLLARETRVRHVAEFEITAAQMLLERAACASVNLQV